MHAVRARPLLIIKNIEPDELREEADTILTRGVNPESLPAPGLRPALYTSVGLVVNANAPTPRARGCFLSFSRGLRPCLSYFAPMRGLSNSSGIRPRVRYFFCGAQIFGSLTLAGSPPQLPICEGTRVSRGPHFTNCSHAYLFNLLMMSFISMQFICPIMDKKSALAYCRFLYQNNLFEIV